MELRTCGAVLMLLGLIFICECMGTKLLTKTRASSNSGNKLKDSKRDLITGTQNSHNAYAKHKPSKWKQLRSRKAKLRKRGYVILTADDPRITTTSARSVTISGSTLSNYLTTGGGSDVRLPKHTPEIIASTSYRRKKAIPDYFNGNKSFQRLERQDHEETEESLDRRSRNRVKLKGQWPYSQRGQSQLNGKHVISDTKTTVSTDADVGQKRQRISGGMVPQPSPVQYGIPHEMSDSLGMADGSNSLHPSHFYTPAVHKFMPVEHRYVSGPIHRYLSSPVVFRRLNGVRFPLVTGGGGGPVATPITAPLEGTVLSPMYQEPPQQGRHVVIINRPVKTPIPVPVRGPPNIVLVHQPVPMPPQRVPVPVLVQHQRRQPIIIVHHKQYSGPGK